MRKRKEALHFLGRRPPTRTRFAFLHPVHPVMVEKHTTGKAATRRSIGPRFQQDTLYRTLKSMKSAYWLALPPTTDE